jgi:tetratricopeptide (TPR) repeat protein
MKISRAGILLLIATVIISNAGCSMVNRVLARNQLNDGAKAYKERKFDVAEQHFRRSLELNPDDLIAEKFLARSLHQQYLANRTQNASKGEQAIEIYQRMLERNPGDEDSNRAVSNLIELIRGQDALVAWLNKRASDTRVAPEYRAEAFTSLASKQYNCANDITEAAKQSVTKDAKMVFVFKKPNDAAEFDKAKQCTAEGTRLIDQALSLNQNNDSTWSYKASLLVQQARLAEMDGNTAERDRLMAESDTAKQRFLALSEEKARKKQEEEERKKAEEEKNK